MLNLGFLNWPPSIKYLSRGGKFWTQVRVASYGFWYIEIFLGWQEGRGTLYKTLDFKTVKEHSITDCIQYLAMC
jgi:hypothetical protein